MPEKLMDYSKNPIVVIVLLLIFGTGGIGIGRYSSNDALAENRQEIAVMKERLAALCETKAEIAEIKSEIAKIAIIMERQEAFRGNLEGIKRQIEELFKYIKQGRLEGVIADTYAESENNNGRLLQMPNHD